MFRVSPAVWRDKVAFVAEGDLWVQDVGRDAASSPSRLTTCGSVRSPCFREDGQRIAFVCSVSGQPEVASVPAEGGRQTQLSWLGRWDIDVLAWPRASEVVVLVEADDLVSPRHRPAILHVDSGTLSPLDEQVNLDDADAVIQLPDKKGWLIGRHTRDSHVGQWKGYGGGARGDICLLQGTSEPVQVTPPDWHISGMCCFGNDVMFVADRTGDQAKNGQLFRVALGNEAATGPTQVTFHKSCFFVRNPSQCPFTGRVVYQLGGAIYAIDQDGDPRQLPCPATTGQGLMEREVYAHEHVEELSLHPQGLFLCALVRGKLFEMALWEGPVVEHASPTGRYFLTTYGRDGRIMAFCRTHHPFKVFLHLIPSQPAVGGAGFVLGDQDPKREDRELHLEKVGIPTEIVANPERDELVFVTNRAHLVLLRYGGSDGGKQERRRHGNHHHHHNNNNNNDNSNSNRGRGRGRRGRGRKGGRGKRDSAPQTDLVVLDHSPFENGIFDVDFSWCGSHVVYAASTSPGGETCEIRLTNVDSNATKVLVVQEYFQDFLPILDPWMRFCIFASSKRTLEVERDQVWEHGMGFVGHDTLMLATLLEDEPNPFLKPPQPPVNDDDDDDEGEDDEEEAEVDDRRNFGPDDEALGHEDDDAPDRLQVDWKGLQQRLFEFPLQSKGKSISSLEFASTDRVLYVQHNRKRRGGDLMCFNLRTLQRFTLRRRDVLWIDVSMDARTVMVVCDATHSGTTADEQQEDDVVDEEDEDESLVEKRVLCFSAEFEQKDFVFEIGGEDNDQGSDDGLQVVRRKGLVDLERIECWVDPGTEWRQMAAEMWASMCEKAQLLAREQRPTDNDMFATYSAAIKTVRSRHEFDELALELLSEFGMSHCGISGGDFEHLGRAEPFADAGFLCVNGRQSKQGFLVDRVFVGQAWSTRNAGPLAKCQPPVERGDVLLNVNGIKLQSTPLQKALRRHAGKEVLLQVRRKADGGKVWTHRVTCLSRTEDLAVRQSEKIDAVRRSVRTQSDNKCGYIRVGSMDAVGFAQFAAAFARESQHEALLLDLRGNVGGFLAETLLEKINKRAVASSVHRWGVPQPFPQALPSTRGVTVILVDEFTSSDAEIFAFACQSLGIATIVGVATWGGVTGVSESTRLVDGTVLSHPNLEFKPNHGGPLENVGVKPDVTVPRQISGMEQAALDLAVKAAMDSLAAQKQAQAQPKAAETTTKTQP